MENEFVTMIEHGDRYEINRLGQIRNKTTMHILRTMKSMATGYDQCSIYDKDYKKKCHVRVHRMVCGTFHQNPENKPCVDHIDRNKRNNRADNLRWVTYKENMQNLNPKESIQHIRHIEKWEVCYTIEGVVKRKMFYDFDKAKEYLIELKTKYPETAKHYE